MYHISTETITIFICIFSRKLEIVSFKESNTIVRLDLSEIHDMYAQKVTIILLNPLSSFACAAPMNYLLEKGNPAAIIFKIISKQNKLIYCQI